MSKEKSNYEKKLSYILNKTKIGGLPELVIKENSDLIDELIMIANSKPKKKFNFMKELQKI